MVGASAWGMGAGKDLLICSAEKTLFFFFFGIAVQNCRV